MISRVLSGLLAAALAAADELENAAGDAPRAETPAAAPMQQPAAATAAGPELSLSNYRLELLLVAFAVVLVANYFRGSRQNMERAEALEAPIGEALRANFSLVGDGRRALSWDSASDMGFYASGRRHCKSAQGRVVLKARQDPIAMLNDVLAKTHEKLEIEVVLDEGACGFVFAAVPRKRVKALCRDRYDIGTFAKPASSDAIRPGTALLSESPDATAQLLDAGLADMLADASGLLEELVVTDCPAEKPDTHDFSREKRLQATIRLPAPADGSGGAKALRDTLEFVFYLVDYLAEGITLRPETTKKLGKARDEAFKEFSRMAEQERQDAVAKIVADKRRAELDEVAKMSPDQRRKWEEKDRKRRLKKEMSKRTRRV
ncbi:hypothetical protein GGF46_000911 [Coemansia sp. RSA 552]|nr:hypothetical protein GGF46_000911 [Coemansia sp. RSA 552]